MGQKTKYAVTLHKRSTILSKTINRGTVDKSRKWVVDHFNNSGLYGIKGMGGFKYDGRIGRYTIYKTKYDKKGRYYVLTFERDIK